MAERIVIPSTESLNAQMSPSDCQRKDTKSVYVSTNADSTSFTASHPYSLCEHMTPDLLSQSLNITLKFISPAASSGPFCRICHEGDTQEDLVSLCKCSGSLGMVHRTCIERWLSTRRNNSGIDNCEICHHAFQTIRYPKSVAEWYQSDQGPITTRHSVLGDIACFSLITPLAAVSTFLCIEGAKRHVLWNNTLEAGCLMALATFLVTVYFVWNILTVRYHLKNYYRWRSINQNVRLVNFRRTPTNETSSHRMDRGRAPRTAENSIFRSDPSGSGPPVPSTLPQETSESNINAQSSNLCSAAT